MAQHGDEGTALLDTIAETALDDDYYEVRPGRYSRSRSFSTVRTAAVLAVFGLIVTLAAVQTRIDRPALQAQRSVLESTLQDRREELQNAQARVIELNENLAELRGVQQERFGEVEREVLIGTRGAQGPGISIVLQHGEDRIAVFDLQRAVNGLWAAGAEAISVNGHRLTTLSAVRIVNNSIIVNYRSISSPYVILAIGDPESMQTEFALVDGGRHLQRRVDEAGIEVDIRTHEQVSMAAAPSNRVTLSYAAIDEEGE